MLPGDGDRGQWVTVTLHRWHRRLNPLTLESLIIRANDAPTKQQEGQIASDRAERIGGIGGGLNVRFSLRVQRHSSRQNNEEGDHIHLSTTA